MNQFTVSVSVIETLPDGTSFVHNSTSLALPKDEEVDGKTKKRTATEKKADRARLSDLIKRACDSADAAVGSFE